MTTNIDVATPRVASLGSTACSWPLNVGLEHAHVYQNAGIITWAPDWYAKTRLQPTESVEEKVPKRGERHARPSTIPLASPRRGGLTIPVHTAAGVADAIVGAHVAGGACDESTRQTMPNSDVTLHGSGSSSQREGSLGSADRYAPRDAPIFLSGIIHPGYGTQDSGDLNGRQRGASAGRRPDKHHDLTTYGYIGGWAS